MSETKKQRLTSEKSDEKLPENVQSNSQGTRISTFKPPRIRRTLEQTKKAMNRERMEWCEKYNFKPTYCENLLLFYASIFSKYEAYDIFTKLESEIEYLSPELSKVQVFGKWMDIPRKQAAYGDDGVIYRFSGNTVVAKPWECCPTLMKLKKVAETTIGEFFNFVMVNRYKDGTDYMGEHRDDEKDIIVKSPIVSFSFGQARDIIFRHKDNRSKNPKRPDVPTFKLTLESGSMLIMEPPTNEFWYHGIPMRKYAPGARVNLTFRRMVKRNIPL